MSHIANELLVWGKQCNISSTSYHTKRNGSQLKHRLRQQNYGLRKKCYRHNRIISVHYVNKLCYFVPE